MLRGLCTKGPPPQFIFSLQHPFCRYQRLHSVVNEPFSPGVGSNPQWALWTLWPSGWGENPSLLFSNKYDRWSLQSLQEIIRSLISSLITGAPLFADKVSGRLLLLRVWGPWATAWPCALLRWDGPGYDQHYTVSADLADSWRAAAERCCSVKTVKIEARIPLIWESLMQV